MAVTMTTNQVTFTLAYSLLYYGEDGKVIGPINMIHTCDVLTYDKRLLCKIHLRSTNDL